MAINGTGSSGSNSSAGKNPKKANLLDQHSIKHVLDESVTEVRTNPRDRHPAHLNPSRLLAPRPSIVNSKGYPEDVRMSNLRLLIGTVIIAIALLAQFYPKKFPQNKEFLVVCIGLYIVFNVLLQFLTYTKEKNAILFTYPPPGSFHTTGLVVSSKLPRFSDMYTLTIASADPKSIAANKPVHLTKSVTKWFTKDGVFVEGIFWKDVEKLIDDYAADRKSK